MNRPQKFLVLGVVVLLFASSAVGCKPSEPAYAESAKQYTVASVDSLFERPAAYEALGQPVSRSKALRHRALVRLRGEGSGAAAAADLITETFPADTRAVPVYVERAVFDGVQALLLLEVVGPASGTLDDIRLWVIDAKGDVLYSQVK